MIGIDVRNYGAVFDGRDNTSAIQSAINAAVGAATFVYFPAGTCRLSATLQIPSGVRLKGEGRNATIFYKNTDYGDMFVFGSTSTAYLSGGASGFFAYHDYGTGAFPPNTPSGMANPTTRGSIFHAYAPSHCIFTDLILGNGKGQWNSFGGVSCQFIGIESYGLYDPTQPTLQETIASYNIDGNSNSRPTDFTWIGCRIGATLSPVRSISWPGGNTSTTTVQNIGPKDGVLIRDCEGVIWMGGYIGGCANNGVRLAPQSSNIASAAAFKGHFIDACGTAGLCLDNTGGVAPEQISWDPIEGNGQTNGLCGISDRVSNLSNWSVIGLTIGGFYRNYVGPAIDLYRAASVNISSSTSARRWNYYGWYVNNAASLGYDAGSRIGNNCVSVSISGLWGGGPAGSGGGYDAIAVRYNSSGNPANVTLGLALGLGTTLSGSL